MIIPLLKFNSIILEAFFLILSISTLTLALLSLRLKFVFKFFISFFILSMFVGLILIYRNYYARQILVVVRCEKAILKIRPSKEDLDLKELKEFDKAYLLAKNNGWSKILVDKTIGWIPDNYVL